MKIKIKSTSLFFIAIFFLFVQSSVVLATEGACSYHNGANCSIGPINKRAVCNDGWLSSVYYYDMVECEGFLDSCKSYLSINPYTYNRNEIKSKFEVLNGEIKILKDDLDFNLYYKQEKEKLELQESFRSRGVTQSGVQWQFDAIDKEYAIKRLETEKTYRDKIDEYDILIKDYNGICLLHTYEEKNNICINNFGSQYKYLIDSCIETSASSISTPANLTTGEPTKVQLDARLKDSGQVINPQSNTNIVKFTESEQKIISAEEPKISQQISQKTQAEKVTTTASLTELFSVTSTTQTTSQVATTSLNKEIIKENIVQKQIKSGILDKIKSFFKRIKFW